MVIKISNIPTKDGRLIKYNPVTYTFNIGASLTFPFGNSLEERITTCRYERPRFLND